jgi:hypothetical protein
MNDEALPRSVCYYYPKGKLDAHVHSLYDDKQISSTSTSVGIYKEPTCNINATTSTVMKRVAVSNS